MRNTQQARRFFSLFLCLTAAGSTLTACGAGQQHALVQKEIHALNNELRDMRKNMAAMENLVEELQDQLVLAEEKLRTSQRAPAVAARATEQSMEQNRRNLEIVRLGPGGGETPTIPGDIPAHSVDDHYGYNESAPSDPVVFQTLNSDGQVVTSRAPADSHSSPVKSTPTAKPEKSGHDLQEMQNYRVAYADFRAGKVKQAEVGFKDFVQSFPQSHLTDNALYWWGECRYHSKDYVGALRLFQRILEEHPSGNKVPDGMVKMGLSLINLGQRDEGLQILRQVSDIYPETPSARVARARHQKISGARP